MKRKKKPKRNVGLEKHAIATRAALAAKSDPKIPDYGNLALRPGASDYLKYPSVNGKGVGGTCTKKESTKYTGDKLLGIATMHKSNAVPITKDSDMAEAVSKMRRN